MSLSCEHRIFQRYFTRFRSLPILAVASIPHVWLALLLPERSLNRISLELVLESASYRATTEVELGFGWHGVCSLLSTKAALREWCSLLQYLAATQGQQKQRPVGPAPSMRPTITFREVTIMVPG